MKSIIKNIIAITAVVAITGVASAFPPMGHSTDHITVTGNVNKTVTSTSDGTYSWNQQRVSGGVEFDGQFNAPGSSDGTITVTDKRGNTCVIDAYYNGSNISEDTKNICSMTQPGTSIFTKTVSVT